MRINAQISEADVINVNAGMPVYFNIIGNPDQKFDAVLKAIEPAPEQISDTSSTDSAIYYVGYIEVPNTERRFRIDMTAQVYIVINQAKNALLIPAAALQPIGKTEKAVENNDDSNTKMAQVRVLKADGSVAEQVVKTGINNRVDVQILSGLNKGDEVILSEEGPAKGPGGRPF